ncbi:MAG: hypothetical protein JST22_09315 [Bacteroidetes bacterium]|nr:hypothetical protein [Bacteroidota bacterium]
MPVRDRIIIVLLLPVLALAAAGCIADPAAPSAGPSVHALSGVIVVNEGVWRQDNATLTLYDPGTGAAEQDYFTHRNPGLRLGDVANSITISNGIAYVAVSTSQTVEILECASGRSIGRVRLPDGNQPRAVTLVDSVTAYAACFGDSIVRFNPRTMSVGQVTAVGPAPESIVYADSLLFVANSGYGFYRQQEPKAGTVGVLDPWTARELALIPVGPNPRLIRYAPRIGMLYVLYGLSDSVGGVVEVDPATLRTMRRWPVVNTRDMAIDEQGGMIYVIGGEGVVRINLALDGGAPSTFLPASVFPGMAFYSIGAAPGGDVYMGITADYSAPGEIVVIARDGAIRQRFPAGINPGDFGFY